MARCLAFGGLALVLCTTVLLLPGCRREDSAARASETWLTMGTVASLSIADSEADEFPAAAAACKDTLAGLERQLSSFEPGSEVSRVSAGAGGAPLPVSPSTLEVVRQARHFAEVSDGRFDPTVWPLMRLWGFHGGRQPECLPTPEAIAATLKQVGYQHLVLGTNTVGLALPGMQLDL